METFYKAYTKQVQNKTYYFVKKMLSFPEYVGVAEIQEGFGMHTDFQKACTIAGLDNPRTIKLLFDEMQALAPQAKVIDLNPGEISLNKKIVH